MELRIYREGGSFRLDEEMLAQQVEVDGFVVFTSTRTRQRQVARAVTVRLEAKGMSLQSGETNSPNGCMCVVDTERCAFREILDIAARADREYEDRYRES